MNRCMMVFVVLSLLVVGCRPPTPAVQSQKSEPKTPASVVAPKPQPVASIPSAPQVVIHETTPEQAEATLSLTVSLPSELGQKTFQIPLKRGPNTAPASEHSHSADRLANDGKGFISLTDRIRLSSSSSEKLVVQVNVHWTAPKQPAQAVLGTVDVPWMGNVKQELASGVKVEAVISKSKE